MFCARIWFNRNGLPDINVMARTAAEAEQRENALIAVASLPNDASAKTKTRVFSVYCLARHPSRRAKTATYRNGVCSLGARISQVRKPILQNKT